MVTKKLIINNPNNLEGKLIKLHSAFADLQVYPRREGGEKIPLISYPNDTIDEYLNEQQFASAMRNWQQELGLDTSHIKPTDTVESVLIAALRRFSMQLHPEAQAA